MEVAVGALAWPLQCTVWVEDSTMETHEYLLAFTTCMAVYTHERLWGTPRHYPYNYYHNTAGVTKVNSSLGACAI